MWWRRKPTPVAVPKFGAIAQPAYPIIYEAYGIAPITRNLVHKLEIGKLTTSARYASTVPPGRLLARKILATEGDRSDDRKLWQHFLSQSPTHYLRFSYRRLNALHEPPKEMLHLWLNFSVQGYDTNSIVRSVGAFLTFVALEEKMPGLLISTKIYTAEVWVVYAFTRWRVFWVEAGAIPQRSPMPDVKGYRLTGDR